jgi:O-antigen ligase
MTANRAEYATQFRWRSAPIRVALSPLAAVLAAVDAAVRRPSYVVAAAILLVCVPSGVQDVTTSGNVTPADLGGVAAAGAVALRMLAGDRAATRRGWLPYAALLFSLAIATVTATDVAESLRGFLRYTELFVLIPVAAAMTIRDRKDTLIVAWSLVAMTAFEGAIGVYQYLTKTGASYAGQYVRAIGTFGADQALALGAVLGYGLVVTLAFGLAQRGRARVWLVAAAAALAVPLGLTLSRGAWIATAAAVLVVLFVFSWRVAAAVLATGALAVCLLTLGIGPKSFMPDERVTSIATTGSEPDRSVKDRYALWGTAVDIWADHPVTGIGLKDFAQYRDSYAPLSLSAGSDVDDPSAGFRREPLLSAHNQYLMVLSEQGTIGILAFGAMLGTLVVAAFRRRRGAGAETDPGDPTGLTERFLRVLGPGVMVWTLIDFLYGDIGAGPTGVVLAVLLGLTARRGVIVPRPATDRSEVAS